MKRVITYGTFDLFHYGHLKILERAREMGDYLIVGVSTDAFNKIKGKKCIYPYEHRAKIVEAIKWVDQVIPEENWEQKKTDIQKYRVDLLVMGNDWTGKFDHLSDLCQVVYLPRTPNISSTEIKQYCSNGHESEKED